MDVNNERFAGITTALADKLTEAFELATGLEKEVREAVLLREGAHRIAVDVGHLRTRVNQLQDDLADAKLGPDWSRTQKGGEVRA